MMPLYAKSDSGWVDSELFLAWTNKVFLRYTVPECPILLFIDEHTSHMTLDVINVALGGNSSSRQFVCNNCL